MSYTDDLIERVRELEELESELEGKLEAVRGEMYEIKDTLFAIEEEEDE